MAHEYVYDVKLFANVRIEAENEAQARAALEKVIDGIDLREGEQIYINTQCAPATVVDVSISEDGEAENRRPITVDEEFQ